MVKKPEQKYEPGPAAPERRRMMREILFHQEAQNRAEWEQPPIEPGDHLSSYAEMMLDPTVYYAVNLIQESILAGGWQIEPAERSSGTLALAEEVRQNLADIDIEEALHDGMDAIWRGFRAQEIAWRYHNRRFRLATLAAIDPDQVALELNDQMRVTAVVSKPIGHEPQTIPRDKLWLHVNRASRTRPALAAALLTR